MTERRVQNPNRPRRRHPALGARISSTGMSVAAMLGIVTVLGAANNAEPQDEGNQTPLASGIVVDRSQSAPRSVVVTELSGQPIQLTAAPVLRAPRPAAAPAAATPVVRTNGSR